MTALQEKLYWRLWGQVRRVKPDADRHEIHRQALGQDHSHKDFSNRDFDRVKAAFLAIAKPSDMTAQIRQAEMQLARIRTSVLQVAAAVEVGDAYIAGIIRRMNSEGRIGQPFAECRADGFDYAHTVDGAIARPELQFDDLDYDELTKVMIALKKVARRKWPTKGDIFSAVNGAFDEFDLQPEAIRDIVCRALCCRSLPRVDKLTWDQLVAILGTTRQQIAEHHNWKGQS